MMEMGLRMVAVDKTDGKVDAGDVGQRHAIGKMGSVLGKVAGGRIRG
jgi:hypothetical protein